MTCENGLTPVRLRRGRPVRRGMFAGGATSRGVPDCADLVRTYTAVGSLVRTALDVEVDDALQAGWMLPFLPHWKTAPETDSGLRGSQGGSTLLREHVSVQRRNPHRGPGAFLVAPSGRCCSTPSAYGSSRSSGPTSNPSLQTTTRSLFDWWSRSYPPRNPKKILPSEISTGSWSIRHLQRRRAPGGLRVPRGA